MSCWETPEGKMHNAATDVAPDVAAVRRLAVRLSLDEAELRDLVTTYSARRAEWLGGDLKVVTA